MLTGLGHPGHRRTGSGRTLPDYGRRNEPGDPPVVLGDRHSFARGETVNEFRRCGCPEVRSSRMKSGTGVSFRIIVCITLV